MNAPFPSDVVTLDRLKLGRLARVVAIDWDQLDPADANRLRHFGFDEDVNVEALHLGPFGKDPLAVRIGRLSVAIRRKHAAAIRVRPYTQ